MEENEDIAPDGMSDKRTELSYQRTGLSYERTLMSWIRTSISLISFGFTIYKVFDEIQEKDPRPRLLTPRVTGLLMIAFGFMALLIAQLQHYTAYKKLKAQYPLVQSSLSSVFSVLILVFGLLLFLAALFRQ